MKISKKQEREYDSFGPWILYVNEADDIPDAFIDRFRWDDTVVTAFKVPRKVERRNTKVGKDLYDYLVILYKDRLEVMHISGNFPNTGSARYDDILAFSKMVDLLHGELTILMREQRVIIPFNSVSEDLIDDVISKLETLCIEGSEFELPQANGKISPSSQLYRNLLAGEQRRKQHRLIASQPEFNTEKYEMRFWDRVLGIFSQWMVRESMILAGPQEFVLYNSLPRITRFKKGHYGFEKTIIPRKQIKGISVSPSPTFQKVFQLNFDLDGHGISFSLGREGIPESLVSSDPASSA